MNPDRKLKIVWESYNPYSKFHFLKFTHDGSFLRNFPSTLEVCWILQVESYDLSLLYKILK